MKDIEVMIRDGLLTINTIESNPGPRYKGTYPQEYLDYIYGVEGRTGYVSIDISFAEHVVLNWFLGSTLDAEEKMLIGQRLGRVKPMPYNALCKKIHSSRELCRQRYKAAVDHLEYYVKKNRLWDENKVAYITGHARTTEFF